jgi:hypothetical protein
METTEEKSFPVIEEVQEILETEPPDEPKIEETPTVTRQEEIQPSPQPQLRPPITKQSPRNIPRFSRGRV